MASARNYNLVELSSPVVYVTPKIPEALQPESFFTPEGHDVLTVEGATKYLTEVHGIKLPVITCVADVLDALKNEPRAALYADGRPQSVFEHMANLRVMAQKEAARSPKLDAMFMDAVALVHDWHEIYAKDTVKTDTEARATKDWREAAGMTLLKRDAELYPELAPYIALLEHYHLPPAQRKPEANAVDVLDKKEHVNFQIVNRARLHHERWEDYREVAAAVLPEALIYPPLYTQMAASVKKLGEGWIDWGCMPFNGNPSEIVDRMTDEIMAKHISSQAAQVHQGNRLIGKWWLSPGFVQREIDSDTAAALKIGYLDDRRT